jgi:putative membrane protein
MMGCPTGSFDGSSVLGVIAMLVWFGFWLLLVVGLALLVIWGIRTLSGGRPSGPNPAVDILNRRYAAGEISQADYEHARRVLEG